MDAFKVTVAICIKCGATKLGALTQCSQCRFFPQENEDKAKAIILSDHFLSETDLDQIGERIQSGKRVEYPEDAVNQYVELFDKNPDMERNSSRFLFGCAGGILVAALTLGLGALALLRWLGG